MRNYREAAEKCRSLLRAVVKQAIKDCLIKNKNIKAGKGWREELVTDPYHYLFESKEKELPSLAGICAVLDVNQEALKKKIRTYITIKEIEQNLSSVDLLREKIKLEKEVQRCRLNTWAWSKMRIKKKALDDLLNVLLKQKAIKERMGYSAKGRQAKYYTWIETDTKGKIRGLLLFCVLLLALLLPGQVRADDETWLIWDQLTGEIRYEKRIEIERERDREETAAILYELKRQEEKREQREWKEKYNEWLRSYGVEEGLLLR